MTRTFWATVALTIWTASCAPAAEPAYRELQLTAAVAGVQPPSAIDTYVGGGRGVSADLGMAITSRLTAGLHFGLAGLERKTEGIGAYYDKPATGNWLRYEGGAFAEYRLSTRRLAPIVSGGIGFHAMHVDYSEVVDGVEGAGMYGVGFDLSAGVQYRGSSRLGAVARVGAGHSRPVADGWFTQGQIGARLYF